MRANRFLPFVPAALALSAALLLAPASPAAAAPATFLVTMSGAQVVPPANNGYSGFAQLTYDATDHSLAYSLVLIGIPPSSVTSAELRQGAIGSNGDVVLQLAGGNFVQMSGRVTLTGEQAVLLLSGALYVEVRGLSGTLIRGQVVGAAFPGQAPTIPVPTLAAPTAVPTAASQGAVRPAVTGVVLPPSTGSGGFK